MLRAAHEGCGVLLVQTPTRSPARSRAWHGAAGTRLVWGLHVPGFGSFQQPCCPAAWNCLRWQGRVCWDQGADWQSKSLLLCFPGESVFF